MRPSLSCRRRTGFTLLEVLVALAVVGIALVAVIKTAGDTAAGTGYLKQKTFAHWIAMNRMEELRIEGQWLRVGVQSGEVELMGQEWRWLQKVSKSPNELTENAMRIVEVSVIPVEGGDEDHPLITMTGFLINPNLLAQQNQRSGNSDPSGTETTP
ncbi:MAG: type II secretion system minor pseudopilin GspI [Gammaproteobacteria bacterium]|nr:type II secretion system minor pseudopilin GspI [Gammaproteobacteria bacterium]